MMRRKFDRVVFRLASAVSKLRLAGSELRLRLCDVCARHFADIEAVPRLLQRLLEHAHVALLHFDDRGVAQIVHVDRGGLEQHGLFEHPQRFARARDLAFRRPGPVRRLLAVEERLRDGGADAARRICAVNAGTHQRIVVAALGAERVGVLIAGARGDRDPRTIAGQRLRHVFVGEANLRALRVQLRIILIGAHQRCLDRVGQSGNRPHKS